LVKSDSHSKSLTLFKQTILSMSAKKQTTVVQTEAPAPELSTSSVVQTATQISKGEVPSTADITSAVNEGSPISFPPFLTLL
jgi:hypothetical protein